MQAHVPLPPEAIVQVCLIACLCHWAMVRPRSDGKLGLLLTSGPRKGEVPTSAHTLAGLGPHSLALILVHLDAVEYNYMRLASATEPEVQKWMRQALKVKTLKDVPLPCTDFETLKCHIYLEFCRLRRVTQAS
jgi:hypothetical protein